MKFVFGAGLALVFILGASMSWAFGESEDGGCCGFGGGSSYWGLSDKALQQAADANGISIGIANELLNERFAEYSNEQLRMLRAMPGEACVAENVCHQMTDGFFRFLVSEAMARRSDAAQNRAAVWDFWRNIGLFFLATLGAVLGVLNYRDKRLERKSKTP